MPEDDVRLGVVPPVLPELEIGARLGAGAGTVVYRARHAGADYAVKVLTDRCGEREAADFRREAARLACLDHRSVVAIHEVGISEGRPYLVMDLIEGRSLAAVLRARGLSEDELLAPAVDVVEGLVAAHRLGVVHRDVKPENIMVTPDGHARLIDFGLAGRIEADAGRLKADAGRLKAEAGRIRADAGPDDDVTVGTFAYAAPEQTGVLRRAVDGRADLYALGVVLFECLAGAPPFAADDAGELIRLHLSQPPPDLLSVRPETTPALARLVARLLAKDPDDRYQSGAGLLFDLRRLAAGERDFPLGTADELDAGRDFPLVGREDEMARLAGRWRLAVHGRGGIAVVHGPYGIGKSRLAHQLMVDVAAGDRTPPPFEADGSGEAQVGDAVSAADPGGAVLWGTCSPDRGVPLGVLREAVDRYAHSVATRAAAGDGAVLAALRSAVGAGALPLGSFSPELADLLALPNGAEEYEPDQLAEAVARLLAGVARVEGGAVLHLDDAQFADDGTRRVLRRLGPLLAGVPLLVVCSVRDDDSADAGSEPAAELGSAADLRIGLQPLSEPAVAELVAVQLGGAAVPADLVTRLAHRAAGNPMAVVEYVRAVVDAGLIRPSWGTWLLDESGLNALALPHDVLELAVRRVDMLPAEARALLTVAAVVGATFHPALVAAVADAELEIAEQSFVDTAGHRLIEAVGGGAYRFVHDQIRERLLAGSRSAERTRLHRRTAEQLELSAGDSTAAIYDTARHYLLGVTGASVEPVVHAAATAGKVALRQSAPQEALHFLTRAAAVAEERDLRLPADVHADLGVAASRVGDYELAQHHLGTALDREPDPLRRAHLYALIADAHHLRWEGDEAIEAIRLGLREVGHRLPRNVVLLIVTSVALVIWGAVLSRVPARWRTATGARAANCRIAATMLIACAQSAALAMRMSLVVTVNQRAVHLVRRLGAGAEQVLLLTGLGMDASGAGRLRHAEAMFERAVAAAEPLGDPRLLAKVQFLHAIAEDVIRPSGPETGARLTRSLREHGRWMDTADYLSGVNCVQEVLLLRGYLRETDDWRREAVDDAGRDARALGIHVAAVEARIAALSGRGAEAAAGIAAIRRSFGGAPPDLPRQVDLAIAAIHVAVEQGEYGAEFDEVVTAFEELGVRPTSVFSSDRVYWLYQASGRLEQAYQEQHRPGDATGIGVADRLAAARLAVRDLGRAANGPILRGYHQAARAALESLQGDHRGALRRLGKLNGWSVGLDVPLLDYDVARIRARACRDLGRHADALRQAETALALATAHGWYTRAAWIRDEFELAGPSSVRSARSRRTAVTGSIAVDLQKRRMAALYQVSLAAATVFDADELTRVVLDEIVRIFGAERAFLFLQEGAALMPYRGRDAGGQDLDRLTGYGSTLVQRVHQTAEPLVVTGSEQGAALGSQSAKVHGLRSIMVAPLSVRGGTLGVVYLDSRAARGIFTTDDVDLLAAITNHVGLAVETARAATLERAVVAAERERDTAQVLHEAMAELTSSLDPDEVAQRFIAVVSRVLPVDTAVLLRRRQPGAKLTMASGSAADTEPVDERDDPILQVLLTAGAVVRGRPEPDGLPLPSVLGRRVAGWLAVPLDTRTEQRGLLLIAAADRPYTAAEAEVATALTRQYQAALDNAVLFRQVQELATRDALTGIYNRRHFFELARQHVATTRRNPQPFATIMIDIDNFKTVNDTHGHGVGDEVIRAVARRLTVDLRESDVLCRYGGEEFAVLLPHSTAEEAGRVAERLHTAVRASPVTTADGELAVTISVGLAATTEPDTDLNLLLSRADEALYEAKRAGRDRVARFGR